MAVIEPLVFVCLGLDLDRPNMLGTLETGENWCYVDQVVLITVLLKQVLNVTVLTASVFVIS